MAAGDVNADGFAEVVTAVASNGPPVVNVFDGRTGGNLSVFLALPASYTGGVNVAVADVFGTGRDQIVTTLASGALPFVGVYDASGAPAAFFLVMRSRARE